MTFENLLSQLESPIIPDNISYIPAIGWWVLIFLVVVVVLFKVLVKYIRYNKAQLYRKQALYLLRGLEERYTSDMTNTHWFNEVQRVLRQVALTAYDSKAITVYGDSWIDLLNSTTAKPLFTLNIKDMMLKSLYSDFLDHQDKFKRYKLLSVAKKWVKLHYTKNQLESRKRSKKR